MLFFLKKNLDVEKKTINISKLDPETTSFSTEMRTHFAKVDHQQDTLREIIQ